MKKEIVKHYHKDGFTVVWKPAKCIHSEICVKTLPEVYRPNEKPWILPEAAAEADLKNQISKCPSGALTYQQTQKWSEESAVDLVYEERELLTQEPDSAQTLEITVLPGGPLLVKGRLKLTGEDGSFHLAEGNTALCRCGGSQNKPHCDGSHKALNFE